MNKKFNLLILSTITLISFPFSFHLFASEINQSKSKIELIEEDLEKSRSDVLSSRQYSLNKDLTSEEIDVVIRPYELSAEQSPDWWLSLIHI